MMEMLDSILGMLGSAWETLGTPKFGSRIEVLNVAPQKMGGIQQAHLVTAAKVAFAAISLSCIAMGTRMVVQTMTRNYSARDAHKAFESKSSIPLSKGEKEPISGPITVISRVKSLFSYRVLPFASGLAAIAGGIFIAAHMNYFSGAFKKI